MMRSQYPDEVQPSDIDGAFTLERAIDCLEGEDLGLRFYAAWWLGKQRIEDSRAIHLLVNALDDTDDRTQDGGYPLRRNSARALGKLGDVRAVPPLITCLSCTDYYVREAACQALGELGDSRAILPMKELLVGGVEAAVNVPGKPHMTQPYASILEALGDLKAEAIVQEIMPFLNHAVPRIRLAAARSLYQCTGDATFQNILARALCHPELEVRRAALLDISATDCIALADDISNTECANSLRLIALKGVLENHCFESELTSVEEIPADVTHVFNLMDSLL